MAFPWSELLDFRDSGGSTGGRFIKRSECQDRVAHVEGYIVPRRDPYLLIYRGRGGLDERQPTKARLEPSD